MIIFKGFSHRCDSQQITLKTLPCRRKKSNSSKTFYEDDQIDDQEFTPTDCFGDFWNDIFNMKITTKNDEEKRYQIQEIQKSRLGRLDTYIRRIILYNSTPKVNLVG